MKTLVLLAFLSCAAAASLPDLVYPGNFDKVLPSYPASKYYDQDVRGKAYFGTYRPKRAAVNKRDAFGNQVGSYSYISPEGKEIQVQYIADSNGFRVLSNALPEAPVR